MHAVRVEVVAAHRLERAGADVQRHERAIATPRASSAASSAASKCRPAVGAATAPGRARVDGLVALAVGVGRRRAVDVGRQRHLAVRVEVRAHRAVELELGEAAVDADHGRAPRRPAGRSAGPGGRPCSSAAARSRAARRACARRRISTAPPVALRPCSRAGSTRVSLRTSRSPGASSPARSRNARSASVPLAPSSASSRLPPRTAGGVWAISSGGSSKRKSARVSRRSGGVSAMGRGS